MLKIIGLLCLISLSSLSEVKLGIPTLDRQIHKFSLLQVYTNKLFKSIEKSAHLSIKGKDFLKNQLVEFQKNDLDSQRLIIQSLIKGHAALNQVQRKMLVQYFSNSNIKKLMKKRSNPQFDLKFENYLMKVNLNKISPKKMQAINNFTKYSNAHSKSFDSELAKLKNLFLLKDLSTKKINKLVSYLKDPEVSKLIATTHSSLSFSQESYSIVNTRFKRIQKKSVKRQLASAR